MKMGRDGLVPTVVTTGEDITEIHSTSTIITSHTFLNFSNMYSWCIDGRVFSTLMACPPKTRECVYSCIEEYVLVCMHECVDMTCKHSKLIHIRFAWHIHSLPHVRVCVCVCVCRYYLQTTPEIEVYIGE